MKYMLLIYLDENSQTEQEREDCYRESAEVAHELAAAGRYIAAGPLHPTTTATSVRVRGEKRMIVDGPFAETREQLGGYFLIEAKSREEAMEWAGRCPAAHLGAWSYAELRDVAEIPA